MHATLFESHEYAFGVQPSLQLAPRLGYGHPSPCGSRISAPVRLHIVTLLCLWRCCVRLARQAIVRYDAL